MAICGSGPRDDLADARVLREVGERDALAELGGELGVELLEGAAPVWIGRAVGDEQQGGSFAYAV